MENIAFHSSLKEALVRTFPFPELIETTISSLEKRLDPFFPYVKTFVSEKQYVDKNWRDLFSLHYCYTQYNKNHSDRAIRIHMFNRSMSDLLGVSSDDYIGYFTLRPIPAPRHVISKVIAKPLPNYLGCESFEELYIMTCDIEANIGSHSFIVQTFPSYTQDSVTTICAHADMLMMAEFMHKKYEMGSPSLKKFLPRIPPLRGRTTPSSGLTIQQIAVCLADSGYELGLKYFNNGEIENLLRTIDAYVESCIPCIIAFNEHVILVVGHTCDTSYGQNYNKAGYIIVDDSGYHFARSFRMNPHIIRKVPYEIFKAGLQTALSVEGVFCFAIEPEKVFLSVDDVDTIIKQRLRGSSVENYKRRYLITESKKIKTFLRKENDLNIFENQTLPHYVWYVEFYNGTMGMADDLSGSLIVDASAHKGDYLYSVLSKDLLQVKKRFSLLQKI